MTFAAGIFLVACAAVLSFAGAFEIICSGARDERRELRGMLLGAVSCLIWCAAALLAAQHAAAVLFAAEAVLILAAWWHGGGRKKGRRAARQLGYKARAVIAGLAERMRAPLPDPA